MEWDEEVQEVSWRTKAVRCLRLQKLCVVARAFCLVRHQKGRIVGHTTPPAHILGAANCKLLGRLRTDG